MCLSSYLVVANTPLRYAQRDSSFLLEDWRPYANSMLADAVFDAAERMR
jgi:hypothetical protein